MPGGDELPYPFVLGVILYPFFVGLIFLIIMIIMIILFCLFFQCIRKFCLKDILNKQDNLNSHKQPKKNKPLILTKEQFKDLMQNQTDSNGKIDMSEFSNQKIEGEWKLVKDKNV
jgi:hypothetical protein